MFKADPVMKAEIDVKDMRSTIQPQRRSPIAQMMPPATTARAEAITCPGISGFEMAALSTILPTIWDMTATGCFVVSAAWFK